MNLAALNAEKARHEAAWKLVCPTLRGAHWKDEVKDFVSLATLAYHGIKIEEVATAIEFFTATVATILPDGAGYLVTAPGYRRGPAGDG